MAARSPVRNDIVCVALSAMVAIAGCTCQKSGERQGVRGSPSRAPADPAVPGVQVDDALEERLRGALRGLGPNYQPRTHHLEPDGSPTYVNRLVLESSPYLLQHAHNPVNWFPWSEEAFERALAEDKPIFLSVGYSTCHWCHVMERESFEDEEIAQYLNTHFIPIKVDREERPDIDSVYMTAVNLLTGRGGWPMTIVMTADKQPFFGGTYFPPRTGTRGARKGLWEILHDLVNQYANNKSTVVEEAAVLSQRIYEASQPLPPRGVPPASVIATAVERLSQRFDREWGGFGHAPKFPQPSRLMLLMRYARRTKDPRALVMTETTLTKMADGGMYDHVGGGFHRYSTDARWLVPHFEKMLYDNAQLATAYLEGFQLTGNIRFANVAIEILDYVVKEMSAGVRRGFYSATDADSPTPTGHDEEGWFFTWTPEEIEQAVGKERAKPVTRFFGVTERGNFEGRNIFFRSDPADAVAKDLGVSEQDLEKELGLARRALYAARAKRPPPILDDKILTAWNGLMISAFAKGALILGDDDYRGRAALAASFVLKRIAGPDGRLRRTYKAEDRVISETFVPGTTARARRTTGGTAKGNAFLGDYAAMIQACLDLYEASGNRAWIEKALGLQAQLDAHYWDETASGYFMTSEDHEALLVREKPSYDGALPSGNSIAALNLVRLSEFTGDPKWRQRAERLFGAFSALIARAPTGFPYLLLALDYYYDTPLEVVIVRPDDAPRDSDFELRQVFGTSYVPNRFFAAVTHEDAKQGKTLLPLLEGKAPLRGKPTAYVCERGRCELPTSNPRVFAKQLQKVFAYPEP